MTTVEAKCKFCGVVLHLKIDPEYRETGDPFKLVSKAACDRCADLKYRQRRITEALEQIAHQVRMCDDNKKMSALRELAEKGLKAFVRMASDWERLPVSMDWDESILEAFMTKPKDVNAVVAGIWGMVRHAKAQRKLL